MICLTNSESQTPNWPLIRKFWRNHSVSKTIINTGQSKMWSFEIFVIVISLCISGMDPLLLPIRLGQVQLKSLWNVDVKLYELAYEPRRPLCTQTVQFAFLRCTRHVWNTFLLSANMVQWSRWFFRPAPVSYWQRNKHYVGFALLNHNTFWISMISWKA